MRRGLGRYPDARVQPYPARGARASRCAAAPLSAPRRWILPRPAALGFVKIYLRLFVGSGFGFSDLDDDRQFAVLLETSLDLKHVSRTTVAHGVTLPTPTLGRAGTPSGAYQHHVRVRTCCRAYRRRGLRLCRQSLLGMRRHSGRSACTGSTGR